MKRCLIRVYPETEVVLRIYEVRTGYTMNDFIKLIAEHFLTFVNKLHDQLLDTMIEETYQSPMKGEPLFLVVNIETKQFERLKSFFEEFGVSEQKGLDILIRYGATVVHNRYLED